MSFQVPLSFHLPKFYESQTPERLALALRIGAQAVENLFDSIANEIREEHNTEVVSQLEKKHLKKQEVLERELDHLRAKFTLDESLKTDMRKQIMDEAKAIYKELLNDKDRRIASLENLHEKFQGVKESLNRQLGSQEKGKAGEVRMEDLIKKSYGMSPNFEIITVAHEAERGDHIMNYKSMKVMWEIKNYNRMVNKEEVAKLHRDMRANPEVGLGIMVALETGIVGHSKAGDIDLEVLEDGRMILYVNNLNRREDPILYLQSLRPILDILENRKTTNTLQESDEAETLRFKAKIVHHILLNHMKTLTTLHNAVVQQKKKTDQMNSELLALVREAESECKNSMTELLNTDDTKDKGSLDSLNPELYTKASTVDLNKNQKIFYEWIQANCVEDEDGEIESKKFLEALKPTLKTEKELKEARDLLQDAVWPKGGKKLRGLRLKA